MPIRIALVEDDQPFASTLRQYLTLTPNVVCEAVFPNAEEALQKIPALAPELLLVDINLPQMNGIEFVTQIVQRCPGILCLMLTMYEESPLIFDALKAGACGYLLKRTLPNKIVTAIEDAKAGGSPMTPQIARQVVSFFQKKAFVPPSVTPKDDVLAGREVELLNLLAQGYRYKEIATLMNISRHTVNNYIRRIYEKMQVHSRAQAVAKCHELKGPLPKEE